MWNTIIVTCELLFKVYFNPLQKLTNIFLIKLNMNLNLGSRSVSLVIMIWSQFKGCGDKVDGALVFQTAHTLTISFPAFPFCGMTSSPWQQRKEVQQNYQAGAEVAGLSHRVHWARLTHDVTLFYSLCPSIYPISVCLFIYCIYLYVYLSVSISIHPSLHPSIQYMSLSISFWIILHHL